MKASVIETPAGTILGGMIELRRDDGTPIARLLMDNVRTEADETVREVGSNLCDKLCAMINGRSE